MPPSTSPMHRERAEEAETSGSDSDMEALFASLRLQGNTPNIDEVTCALGRKLNIGNENSDRDAVRVMAAALLQWSLKEKMSQEEAGVQNEQSAPGSSKENETVQASLSVSKEASSPFTATPTISNTTPMSFARHNTPSTRDRTPTRPRPARSRSKSPMGAFLRQRSLTPDPRTVDPSPNKRSYSPFRQLFTKTNSDVTPNAPFDEAPAKYARPPVPPIPVRPIAASEPILVDTPADKTVHSFPSPPSTTGKTFCSPAASTSFQWSDLSPESQRSTPSVPQPGLNATAPFQVGGASQPGTSVPKLTVVWNKSKNERTTGSRVRRSADRRVPKAGGPERSYTNTRRFDTSQTPTGPAPVSTTVPGMQQTLSGDSSCQSTQSMSMFTSPLYAERAAPRDGMDVSPAPSPVHEMGVQFSIGKGDKKAISTRSKRNPRKAGSPGKRGIHSRTSQRAVSGIFPRTSQIAKTIPGPHASHIHMNPSNESADSSGGQTLGTASTCSSEVDNTGRQALVSSLRDEARNFYSKHDFCNAVLKYTTALKVQIGDPCTTSQSDDVRALILANRSAALLMLDAYELAAADCQHALQFVSDQNVGLASDCGPMLKAKLFTRLGKALLKVGKLHEAEQSFCNTISTANSSLALVKQLVVSDESQQNERFLTHLITDAESGKIEVKRCREAADEVLRYESASLQSPTESGRRNTMQALIFVNKVLQFAPGSAIFHEKKLTLLASLKRWRELAGHCERLAASTTKSDGIWEGDLAGMHPFPQALQTKSLEATFFDNDAVESSTKKLGVKAVGEAVVRLPNGLLPFYLRALRLEERYPQAISAIDALENLVKLTEGSSNHQSVRVQFAWLSRERDKVSRTQTAKDRGDAFFRNGDYEAAVAQYTSCLTIDGERLSDVQSGEVPNAGGRLHAILHCNRAACHMALKKYHEAVTDCTYALRIHCHYMKAMLRRSRCYFQLQRYEEATVEFNRWLELIEKAKKAPQELELSATPCLFDSPREISDAELEKVKKELLEVGRAKRMAENTARSEASFRESRRHWYEDSFGQKNQCDGDAQQRREQWYNQQGTSSYRWDSFAGRSPKKEAKPDQKPQQQRQQQQHGSQYGSFHGRNNRQAGQQPQRSPVSDSSADHYSVLDVVRNASASQIKKAYRKMALKYHPDKNDAPEAADKFRRVKLAYETLNDPTAKQRYDTEMRWSWRF